MDSPPNTLEYRAINPADGQPLARFATMADRDVDEHVGAADAAYRAWAGTRIQDRAAVAGRAAAIFRSRADELARLASLEMGKPLPEALEELEFCASIFEYYADRGPALAADQPIESFAGDRAVLERRPLGVLLGVMPWNFPYYQVARFVAPNVVIGNTILLKHAESVPQCARAFESVMAEAGAPAGVYRNLFASHSQVERIIADDRVRGVSLTGSERAGSAVAAAAGRHLKKCVLELGGSDPYIVLDAADPAQAAEEAWAARLYNTGQLCNSNKRIIVHSDLFDPFVAALSAYADRLRPGDPLRADEGTYAPLSSRAAAERVHELVTDAVGKGATLHAGGELAPAPSAYYSPAVLTGVSDGMRAFSEELFGPVAVVYRVDSDDEAVALANDSDYGLGGSVFSGDERRALDVARRLETGMSSVNTFAGEGPEIPFGGVKRSGFGRELGPIGMDEFVNKRLLYVK